MAQLVENPPAIQETACSAGDVGSIAESGHERGGVGQEKLSENMCESVGGSDRRRSLETRSQNSIIDYNYFTLKLLPTLLETLESTAIRQAVY